MAIRRPCSTPELRAANMAQKAPDLHGDFVGRKRRDTPFVVMAKMSYISPLDEHDFQAIEPSNPASPNEKMPPSEATSQ